jgi:hypothetical protein
MALYIKYMCIESACKTKIDCFAGGEIPAESLTEVRMQHVQSSQTPEMLSFACYNVISITICSELFVEL